VVKSELAAVGINVSIQSYELLTAYDKEDNGHSQMGERYWTNDIIDPRRGGHVRRRLQGRRQRLQQLLVQHPGQLAGQPGARRAQQRYAAADVRPDPADRLPAVAVRGQSTTAPNRYGVGDWVHGFHATPLGNYDLSLETLTVSSH